MPTLIPIGFFSSSLFLRDEFTTAQAAPLTSPRACDPGPGTLTIVDASNVLSIAGGGLTKTNTANSADVYSAIIPQSGVIFKISSNYTAGGSYFAGFTEGSYGATIRIGSPASFYPPYYTAQRRYAWAMLSYQPSMLLCADLETGEIIGMCEMNAIATVPYVFLTGNAAYVVDYMRIARLATSAFFQGYGLTTARNATPASGATLTHTANGYVGSRWTAATGAVHEIDVRYTDDDNRWIIRCSQAGGTIKIIERNAGVETERSSAAQTWANGTKYHIVVWMNAAVIITYISNAQKNFYSLATFNQTATTSRVTATGGTLTEFTTWPRTLPAAALAELVAV